MKKLIITLIALVLVGAFTHPAVFALSTNQTVSNMSITNLVDINGTKWMYVHSEPAAPRIVVEVAGGVAYGLSRQGPFFAVSIQNGIGVGGLYVPSQVDELILASFPRLYSLIGNTSMSFLINTWFNSALAWASRNYTEIHLYGYSAGATLVVRAALDRTFASVIAKAYPNSTCYLCYANASQYTTPILLLTGTNDTVAPLTGDIAFLSRVPNDTLKTLITYPTDHVGMSEVLPTAEQQWLLNPTGLKGSIPETLNPTLMLMLALIPMILFSKRKIQVY